MHRMSRKQLLAAEVFGYSYAQYAEHLGMGHGRFEKLMPHAVDVLQEAERDSWDASRLARVLDIGEEETRSWQRAHREAKDVVDAPTPAEAFRRGMGYQF